MMKKLTICITCILLCVGCVRKTSPFVPTTEPSILPIDEGTPTIIPSPSNDVLATPSIEPSNDVLVIPSIEPSNVDRINKIADYLYQAVGVNKYFGGYKPSKHIIGNSLFVDIYSSPWVRYEKDYGTVFYYIFCEPMEPIDDLQSLEENYVMFVIEYSNEAKRATQTLSKDYYAGSMEEIKDVMAYLDSNADNIEYVGQHEINFSYSKKPEYMNKFLFMDKVLTILRNEIEGEFTVYEGPVTISIEFEAVKLCIDINGVKYSSFACGEYSLSEDDDTVIDYGKKYGFNNSIYFIAEDEEGNSCIYSPPIDSSDEEYIRKIVEFGRKTVVHNTPS